MTDFAIRAFEERDTPQLIERIREVQAHESRIDEHVKAPDEIGTWYLQKMLEGCAEHKGVVFVAVRAETVIGYACLLCEIACTDPDEKDYTYALVAELGVAPDQRGRGLGRRLIESCRKHAEARGVRYIRIGVLAENHGALRLYEDYGFKPRTIELEMAI